MKKRSFSVGGKGVDSARAGAGVQAYVRSSWAVIAGPTADHIVERPVAKYASQHEITVATSGLLEQQTATRFGALLVSAEGLRPWLADAPADMAREMKKQKREL